jgi:hypothetical protein
MHIWRLLAMNKAHRVRLWGCKVTIRHLVNRIHLQPGRSLVVIDRVSLVLQKRFLHSHLILLFLNTFHFPIQFLFFKFDLLLELPVLIHHLLILKFLCLIFFVVILHYICVHASQASFIVYFVVEIREVALLLSYNLVVALHLMPSCLLGHHLLLDAILHHRLMTLQEDIG